MTKEQAYDNHIAPLMSEVIAICDQHKISMAAQFALPDEEHPDLVCSTCLVGNEYDSPKHHYDLIRIMRRSDAPAMRLSVRNADGTTVEESIIVG